MPRHTRRVTFVLALALALVTVAFSSPIVGRSAQEATPAAGDAPPIEGVTFAILGGGEPSAAPGQTLAFVRMIIEPGGFISAHGHPGAQIWYVESGAFSTEVLEGALRVTRAAVGGTPVPAEQLVAGAEASLTAGDSAFFDADVVHIVRHTGDEPTIVLIPALLATGQPPLIFHAHDQATPTAATPEA
jgi:quercetin dioxygenase-like cupin family protein